MISRRSTPAFAVCGVEGRVHFGDNLPIRGVRPWGKNPEEIH